MSQMQGTLAIPANADDLPVREVWYCAPDEDYKDCNGYGYTEYDKKRFRKAIVRMSNDRRPLPPGAHGPFELTQTCKAHKWASDQVFAKMLPRVFLKERAMMDNSLTELDKQDIESRWEQLASHKQCAPLRRRAGYLLLALSDALAGFEEKAKKVRDKLVEAERYMIQRGAGEFELADQFRKLLALVETFEGGFWPS